MADTTVKCITSSMTGGSYVVPSLSGTAGALAAVLDFALINGGATQTVDSIIILGNVATVTRATGHPFEAGSVSTINGATVTGGTINGQQRITSVTSTTYTFDVTLANQTAAGTITHAVPSLGWTQPFTGTNLRTYRSSNVASLRPYLKIDDTGTTDSRVVGFETMTSISDTTGNQYPTTTQLSGGLYWPKSNIAGVSVRNWAVIGDDRAFILWVEFFNAGTPAGNSAFACGFGDLTPARSTNSQYDCFITGGNSSFNGTTTPFTTDLFHHAIDTTFYMARSNSGATISQSSTSTPFACFKRSAMFMSTTGSFSGGAFQIYPDPSGNLVLTPFQVYDGATSTSSITLRGYIPGVAFCMQLVGPTAFIGVNSVINISNAGNRRYKCLNQTASGAYGPTFVDMTGPWR